MSDRSTVKEATVPPLFLMILSAMMLNDDSPRSC